MITRALPRGITSTLSYERGKLGRWAGTVLQATYRLGREVARGALGEIYEAGHDRLPGRFAVKILRAELASNRDAFARFCREAEVMSLLRHPHTVQIFDFNTTPEGLPYYVMEYVEGVDLQTRLGQEDRLPVAEAAGVVEAVASALAAAHQHGIVHGSLVPSDIVLMPVEGTEELQVKVLHLGPGYVRRPDDPGPRILAPELTRGGKADPRTDQFALAVIAYELLTGLPAFDTQTAINDPPPALAPHLPGDTAELQAVFDRALAADPPERFETMLDFSHAFRIAVEGSTAAAYESAQALPAPPPASAAPIPGPGTSAETMLSDELSPDENLLPRTHGGAIVAGIVGLALAGLVMWNGWYREVPAYVDLMRENAVTLAVRPGATPHRPPPPLEHAALLGTTSAATLSPSP